jgi:hypothetical protein
MTGLPLCPYRYNRGRQSVLDFVPRRAPEAGLRLKRGSPAVVDTHLNNLLGQQIGIDNLGSGGVNATENWWGCAKGPGFPGCTSVSGLNVVSTPFLTHPSQRED